jgi:hypothetical protein
MAQALASTPDDPEVLYFAALLEVAVGRADKAVQYISAAYEADADYSIFIIADPDLARLNSHADYKKLLDQFP